MKLSLHSEYALLALIYVARQGDSITTSAHIGSSLKIPSDILHEVLAVLVNARYLRLLKGELRLAKAAEKISVAEIIRLFDGALAPIEPVSEKGYAPSPMEEEEKLSDLFSNLQNLIVKRLETTTLKDLV